VSGSDLPLASLKLQRFMISLPSFDNERLILHATRQTLRKAEMARLIVHEWLNQHEPELKEWKAKTASELGISVSELEWQLIAAAEDRARLRERQERTDS